MRTPRRYWIAFALACGFAGIVVWFSLSRDLASGPAARAHGPSARSASLATSLSGTPTMAAADSDSIPPRKAVEPERDGFYSDYFHRELRNFPAVATIYRDMIQRLPQGRAGELAAIFISEALVRNQSKEFSHFMSSLLAEIRAESSALASLIESQDETFKKDPFVYQMVLNLVFQLDASPDTKARLFGSAMSIPLATDSRTGVTLMSANITNALILMANSGVSVEQAVPYIQRGLAANQHDPEALREFAARANTYFPGSI